MHASSCANTPASETSTPPALPRRHWRSRLVRLAALALLLLAAWEIGRVALVGNLHEIIPGQIYRGAQPSAHTIETYVRQYKIRTVLNVRGCCFPDSWYVEEAEACQRLGIHLEDVTFSAMHLPSRHELRALVEVLDRAEYPIFMHCRHGSDRTGIAAMIAYLLRDEYTYESARRQLGLRYGHLPIGKTTMLDRFIELYEQWLSANGREHAPARFRHWVLEEYRGGWCEAHFEDVRRRFDVPRVNQPLVYDLIVRNKGNAPWQFRPLKTAGFHVTFKVLGDAQETVHEGRAGMLDAVVPPGEKIQLALIVPPIKTEGHYRLLIDMIEEGHCWFHQTGSELWQEELEIRE